MMPRSYDMVSGRAQENLQTVADLLREAMQYQGVSREMQKVISVEVSKESLDDYIAAAVSIHDALEHFQTKAPENPEGRTLELMEKTVLRALEAKFEVVLQVRAFCCYFWGGVCDGS